MLRLFSSVMAHSDNVVVDDDDDDDDQPNWAAELIKKT